MICGLSPLSLASHVEPVALPIEPQAIAASQERMNQSYELARLCGRPDTVDRAFLGRVAFIGGIHRSEPSRADFSELVGQGQNLQSSGRYEEALQKYQQALALDHPDRPIARFLHAAALTRDLRCPENAPQALAELETAEKELSSGSTMSEREVVLLALIQQEKSQVLGKLDRKPEAYRAYEKALNDLRSCSMAHPKQKEALMEMATIALRAGLWVMHLFEGAGHAEIINAVAPTEFRICRLSKNFRGEAKLYFEIGFGAHQRGDFENALHCYENALTALNESGDEQLSPDSPVEKTNWTPFLRLMANQCDMALSLTGVRTWAVLETEELERCLDQLLQSPPKGLGFAHALELVQGLSAVHPLDSKSFKAAEDTFDLLDYMVTFLSERRPQTPESYLTTKIAESHFGRALLYARDPERKEEALEKAHEAFVSSLVAAWKGLPTRFGSTDLNIEISFLMLGQFLSDINVSSNFIYSMCLSLEILLSEKILGFRDSSDHQRIRNAIQLISMLSSSSQRPN